MGAQYRDEIDHAFNLRCFLRANVTELIPHRSGQKIERVEAATLAGRKLRFEARRYVICCGAIENARLLLLSDSVLRGGVGNQHDLVGRYFADHGTQYGVHLVIPSQRKLRVFQEERFVLEEDKNRKPRKKRQFRDTKPVPSHHRSDKVGFRTTNAHRKKHATLGFAMITLVPHGWDRVLKSALAVDALATPPGRASRFPPRQLEFAVIAEQSPNPDSRITLVPEKDALGLRVAKVELRSQGIDRQSRSDGRRQFALAVGRAGSGRVRLSPVDDAPWMNSPGGHHSGTTRMANDPKRGVADRDGRVHGVGNLFVMGSSLFTTPGWQHPTLTILALALRLADLLQAEAGNSSS
jgi:choline dehydrogenase-like flavoprotein